MFSALGSDDWMDEKPIEDMSVSHANKSKSVMLT